MDKKEYNELLLKYYTENNSFIEKGIFTVSSGAITVLLGYSDKIQESILYQIAVWGFVLTLFLQLISARLSKMGCDKGLDKKHPENGDKWFNLSEYLDNVFLLTFMISVALAGFSILNNSKQSVQTQLNDNKIKFKQIIKIKENDMEYDKLINRGNSSTPVQPNPERKGFKPPKTLREEQSSQTSGQQSSQTSEQPQK